MTILDEDADAIGKAIRALLARPLLLRSQDADLFRSVAIHRSSLSQWFEDDLGWQLQVDVRSGIARLHKRVDRADPRRGLRRTRSSKRPFDPLRYQLLALVCAELLRRPHAALGDLADAVARLCGADEDLADLDLTRHADRVAFVDVLLWLLELGAVEVTAGEVEGFGGSQDVDAVLRANTTLLPLLLSSDRPPSRVDAHDPESWVEQLLEEPRYGTAATDPGNTDRDQRARWARHQVVRRLVDEPAVDLDELHPVVRDYLYSPSGREKVLSAARKAGFVVERHADAWIAIDPSRESTPNTFGSTGKPSTAEQAAAVLLATLVTDGADGDRRLVPRTIDALQRVLQAYMERNPRWARSARARGGSEVLAEEAIDLLEEFGLVVRRSDEITPRPAAARFSVRIATQSPDEEEPS